MQVTFTKLTGRRYTMTIVREHGPELAPRQGPGYDDHIPHEAAHLIVEREAGLSGGVFGRLAAGQSNIFWPVDPAVGVRQRRRERRRRPTASERADMGRSELLASVCVPLWELSAGRRSTPPDWFARLEPDILESPLTQRIVEQLDAFAGHWHALGPEEGITVQWPSGRPGGTSAHGSLRSRRASLGA